MLRFNLFSILLVVLIWSAQNQSLAQQATQASPTKQSATPGAHEDLDGVLWMQTSGEFEAITRQTYRLAESNLGDALVDPSWTASTEQQQMFAKKPQELAKLPPAVILDVDETVLNNTQYQARLIEACI